MKRTNFILFALFLLLSLGQLWAQEQKPYKPAATFKGDTLRYLEYNYTIRQSQYIGKTIGEALKDLEYPVVYVTGIYQIGDGPSRLAGLFFVVRQMGTEPNELKDYYIRIWFADPPILDEYQEASKGSGNNLSPQVYNFIKDLKVSSISSNQYIFKDPVLLEGQRRATERTNEMIRRAIEENKRINNNPSGQ